MDAYDLIRAVMRAERVQLTQKSADTHFVHKQTLALLKAKKKTQLKEKFMYITMHFMLTNKNLAECRLRSFIVYKSIIMKTQLIDLQTSLWHVDRAKWSTSIQQKGSRYETESKGNREE